jgi:hypothetical protein
MLLDIRVKMAESSSATPISFRKSGVGYGINIFNFMKHFSVQIMTFPATYPRVNYFKIKSSMLHGRVCGKTMWPDI